jgi:hypothetical protein
MLCVKVFFSIIFMISVSIIPQSTYSAMCLIFRQQAGWFVASLTDWQQQQQQCE